MDLLILYIFAIIGCYVVFYSIGRKVVAPVVVGIYLLIKGLKK